MLRDTHYLSRDIPCIAKRNFLSTTIACGAKRVRTRFSGQVCMGCEFACHSRYHEYVHCTRHFFLTADAVAAITSARSQLVRLSAVSERRRLSGGK